MYWVKCVIVRLLIGLFKGKIIAISRIIFLTLRQIEIQKINHLNICKRSYY